MSLKLMTVVWDLDLPPGEKLVLLALADQANDDGTQCWPSVPTIARRSGQGVRNVRRALESIEAKGHLTRAHRDGASTQYRVHPCCDPDRSPQYHYVYRVCDPASGEFYVGARTCHCEIGEDPYMGSGKWVQQSIADGKVLTKVVLSTHDSRTALAIAESGSISAVIGLPGCMNLTASTPANLAGAKMAGVGEPLPKTTETPANLAPKPSLTTKGSEAKASSQRRARRSSKKKFELPSHIPAEPWRDFTDMRRRIGKAMTLRAMELAVTRLDKLAEDGWPPGDVLNHSTLNSYQGLFPPKQERISNGRAAPESLAEGVERILAEREAARDDSGTRPSLSSELH